MKTGILLALLLSVGVTADAQIPPLGSTRSAAHATIDRQHPEFWDSTVQGHLAPQVAYRVWPWKRFNASGILNLSFNERDLLARITWDADGFSASDLPTVWASLDSTYGVQGTSRPGRSARMWFLPGRMVSAQLIGVKGNLLISESRMALPPPSASTR